MSRKEQKRNEQEKIFTFFRDFSSVLTVASVMVFVYKFYSPLWNQTRPIPQSESPELKVISQKIGVSLNYTLSTEKLNFVNAAIACHNKKFDVTESFSKTYRLATVRNDYERNLINTLTINYDGKIWLGGKHIMSNYTISHGAQLLSWFGRYFGTGEDKNNIDKESQTLFSKQWSWVNLNFTSWVDQNIRKHEKAIPLYEQSSALTHKDIDELFIMEQFKDDDNNDEYWEWFWQSGEPSYKSVFRYDRRGLAVGLGALLWEPCAYEEELLYVCEVRG